MRGRPREGLLLVGLALLRQQHAVDVGQHAAARDRDRAEQLAQLLVVADRL